jgi:hypothetical protein
LTRRFIVAEGLYAKTGQIAPIRNLIEIKNRYKYRLILDESISLGALGERGLGAADHFQLPVNSFDQQMQYYYFCRTMKSISSWAISAVPWVLLEDSAREAKQSWTIRDSPVRHIAFQHPCQPF